MCKNIILLTMHESPQLQSIGFTIIRISFGIIFLNFGYQKLISDSAHITQIGSAISFFGITWGHIFWGYLAALTELCAGISFILGFCTRITAIPLIWLLIVALRFHKEMADPFTIWAFPCTCLFITIALLIAGSGIYSIDYITRSHYTARE